MIVTLNEVEQWCLRAMAGAGMPPGVAEDAAASSSWLVAHEFAVLESLVSALNRWDGDAGAIDLTAQSAEETPRVLDAAGRSAVFLSGLLVDAAVAAATAEGASVIQVFDLNDPLFLLPPAERYRQRGWTFALSWSSGVQACGAAYLDRNGATLFGQSADARTTEPLAATIACAGTPSDLTPDTAIGRLPVSLTAEDLAARTRGTLENGIEVADETWARLKQIGLRALVPASAESRQRGAGSQASDNE